MAEAKKVALTIGERLAAIKLFDAFKGSITQLRSIWDDIKPFAVSDEEWKAANLVKTPIESGGEQWKWDDTGTKDIEIQEATVEYLK